MTDPQQEILDAAQKAADAAIDTIIEEQTKPVPSPEESGDEPTSYPEVFEALERNEAEWARLERSAAGEALKAAFVAARPFLVPIAQEAGKQGVALLFGQLAERIANK